MCSATYPLGVWNMCVFCRSKEIPCSSYARLRNMLHLSFLWLDIFSCIYASRSWEEIPAITRVQLAILLQCCEYQLCYLLLLRANMVVESRVEIYVTTRPSNRAVEPPVKQRHRARPSIDVAARHSFTTVGVNAIAGTQIEFSICC